jgi:hypothetical protein
MRPNVSASLTHPARVSEARSGSRTLPAEPAHRRGRRRRGGAIDRGSGGRVAPPRRRGRALRGAGARRGARSPRPGSGVGPRSGHTRARQTRTPGPGAGPRATASGPVSRRPPWLETATMRQPHGGAVALGVMGQHRGVAIRRDNVAAGDRQPAVQAGMAQAGGMSGTAPAVSQSCRLSSRDTTSDWPDASIWWRYDGRRVSAICNPTSRATRTAR